MLRRHTLSASFLRLVLSALSLVLVGTWSPVAAQQLAFRTYNQADGLMNAWASCLHQDISGFILACTEHGLFVYDGRRFFNLGPQQGLPDGGFIHALAFDRKNRIILRYSHSIFIASEAISNLTSLANLRFQRAQFASVVDDDERGQIVPWRDGAIFAAQGRLLFAHTIDVSSRPVIERVDNRFQGLDVPLQDATPLASQGATIWVAQSNGEICGLTDLIKSCFGPREGLSKDNWAAFLVTRSGHVLARSANHLAEIDPISGKVAVHSFPNQGGRYANYPHRLFLAETASGQLVTQSSDGLMIREGSDWRMLTTNNGLPTVPILSVLFDHEGNLWLGVLGKGVLRALGYGLWENLDHHDGLSNDVLWQMTRQPNGPLWIATDEGIDGIGTLQPKLARRHFDKPSFAVAIDDYGHLWRSTGSTGASCISLSTGEITSFTLPAVDKILLGAHSRLWFLTERGLYLVEDTARPSAPRLMPEVTGPVTAAVIGADGSLWVVRQGHLLHLHVAGAAHSIEVRCPQPAFEPLTLAISKTGVIWTGGAGGGVYRLSFSGDHLSAVAQFGAPEIISNTVVSILVDSRGWVWVGTDNGISVFDGKRWVSANTDNGLVWNDLDQESLYEDADGSMWFGTSQGLSHLLKPARLFQQSTPLPVITSVQIGGDNYREKAVPFSREPLLVQFGSLNFQADGTTRFRYRLDGVDKDWAETASGYARYPSIPTGHHRFEVVAYNPLTHQLSQPVSVLLRMQRPWWLWWPLLFLYTLSSCGTAYSILRLRVRMLIVQRRALQREVEVRTRDIRQAQAALQVLATQDYLTKLLTRGEIQSRISCILENSEFSSRLTIALLDIDHFKNINDRYGHLVGDDILREMGTRLRQAMRPNDYAGRYGGEEILIALEGHGPSSVERIHSLSDAICNQLFPAGNEMITVTCSIGITYSLPQDDWACLISRADQALYKAKAQGRDRIVVSTAIAAVDGTRAIYVTERHLEGYRSNTAPGL